MPSNESGDKNNDIDFSQSFAGTPSTENGTPSNENGDKNNDIVPVVAGLAIVAFITAVMLSFWKLTQLKTRKISPLELDRLSTPFPQAKILARLPVQATSDSEAKARDARLLGAAVLPPPSPQLPQANNTTQASDAVSRFGGASLNEDETRGVSLPCVAAKQQQ